MHELLLLITGAIARAHDRWRSSLGRRPLSGEISRLQERVARVEAENELLRRRLLRVPARRRPYYMPWERLEILIHGARFSLSAAATAHAFALDRKTVQNWMRAAERNLRSVRPRTPIDDAMALVRDLTWRLKAEWPNWGTRRIAGMLVQLGIQTSRTTVQRVLKRRRPRPRGANEEPQSSGPVVAKHPNHVWILDFTRLSNGFRTVYVGAAIDAYSRKVMAICVAPIGPSARQVLRMLRAAVSGYGTPAHIVGDQGPEFTAGAVARWMKQRTITHRFGAIRRKGSVALIERFWRAMKTEYAHDLTLYLPKRTLERKLKLYARWFNEARPHQGLDQRTPEQVYCGRRRKARRHLESGGLEVHHLGGDRRLPVLRFSRAA